MNQGSAVFRFTQDILQECVMQRVSHLLGWTFMCSYFRLLTMLQSSGFSAFCSPASRRTLVVKVRLNEGTKMGCRVLWLKLECTPALARLNLMECRDAMQERNGKEMTSFNVFLQDRQLYLNTLSLVIPPHLTWSVIRLGSALA
ncbi:hypothetical protein WG66_007390 [Moniliophthora roreri]|nr:hypothetical protein WG66_007390 [Moniliophthora roreri]